MTKKVRVKEHKRTLVYIAEHPVSRKKKRVFWLRERRKVLRQMQKDIAKKRLRKAQGGLVSLRYINRKLGYRW